MMYEMQDGHKTPGQFAAPSHGRETVQMSMRTNSWQNGIFL